MSPPVRCSSRLISVLNETEMRMYTTLREITNQTANFIKVASGMS